MKVSWTWKSNGSPTEENGSPIRSAMEVRCEHYGSVTVQSKVPGNGSTIDTPQTLWESHGTLMQEPSKSHGSPVEVPQKFHGSTTSREVNEARRPHTLAAGRVRSKKKNEKKKSRRTQNTPRNPQQPQRPRPPRDGVQQNTSHALAHTRSSA